VSPGYRWPVSGPDRTSAVNAGVLVSLVYCGAAFGGAFLFMRLAAPELPALVVAFGRVSIAALLLLPFVGWRQLLGMREQWRHYAVVGFFMAAAPFALFAFAERSITAGLGSIINATTPLWTAIILAVWLRQAPTSRRVAAIVVGFLGVGVIVGLEGLQLAPDAAAGIVAATAGAASYGLALTYIRRRMGPQRPIPLAAGQLIAATVMLAPLAAISASDVTITTEAVVAILGIAVLSTAIAWPILFRLNREVGPMATSTVTFLNPVFGTLWGAIFLAEAISPTFLLGALLVFASLGLILDVRPLEAMRGMLRPATPASVPAEVDE
jgi:drug/metabolite transporter (DMT)-like permease